MKTFDYKQFLETCGQTPLDRQRNYRDIARTVSHITMVTKGGDICKDKTIEKYFGDAIIECFQDVIDYNDALDWGLMSLINMIDLRREGCYENMTEAQFTSELRTAIKFMLPREHRNV